MTNVSLPSSRPTPDAEIDSSGLWGAPWIICGQKRAAGRRKNSETKVIKWWSQQLHELFIFLEPICLPSVSCCTVPLQPPHLSKPTAVQALLKLWFSFPSCHFLRTVCNKGDGLLGKRRRGTNEKRNLYSPGKKKAQKLHTRSGGRSTKVDNDQ